MPVQEVSDSSVSAFASDLRSLSRPSNRGSTASSLIRVALAARASFTRTPLETDGHTLDTQSPAIWRNVHFAYVLQGFAAGWPVAYVDGVSVLVVAYQPPARFRGRR